MARKNDDCAMDRTSDISNVLSKNKYSIATQTFESFESIANAIRKVFPRFHKDSDPLVALMTCRERRFFLPMMYALVRLLKTTFFDNNRRLVSRLSYHVFERHGNDDGLAWILLKNMETRIDLKLVEDLSEMCTFDTMVYCAMNRDVVSENETVLSYDEKVQLRLRHWLDHVKEDLLHCSTVQEVEQLVQWILEICFPIVNTTKNRVFIWDPFDETWCLVTDLTATLCIIMTRIWNDTKEFMLGEFVKLDYDEERELLWSNRNLDWLLVAKNIVWQEHLKIFKIHEDVYPKRRLQQDRILKHLSIEHESANVPELYFLEERQMKWIQDE